MDLVLSLRERALAKGDGGVATARNPKAISERFANHPNLLAVKLDVTNEEQAVAAAEAAIERFRQIGANGKGSHEKHLAQAGPQIEPTP